MRGILIFIFSCAIFLSAGCAPEQQQESRFVERPAAVYDNLKGHSAAVMVWADWRTRTEYNEIQIDVAKRLTAKLEQRAQPKKEKKPATSPVQFTNPASVVRFQREHPEVMSM